MPRHPTTSLPEPFIPEFRSAPALRGWRRLLRWSPMGLLPLLGACTADPGNLLCQLGTALGLGGGCATTLAVGEEG